MLLVHFLLSGLRRCEQVAARSRCHTHEWHCHASPMMNYTLNHEPKHALLPLSCFSQALCHRCENTSSMGLLIENEQAPLYRVQLLRMSATCVLCLPQPSCIPLCERLSLFHLRE